MNEEIEKKYAARQRRRQRRFERLMIEAKLLDSFLDEEGYPTAEALKLVEIWPWSQSREWFEFIKSIWNYTEWGWKEKEEPHEYKEDTMVYRYHISTAGWSGNESIVNAMERNSMMWHLNWVQSRRGGHYIFELKD